MSLCHIQYMGRSSCTIRAVTVPEPCNAPRPPTGIAGALIVLIARDLAAPIECSGLLPRIQTAAEKNLLVIFGRTPQFYLIATSR